MMVMLSLTAEAGTALWLNSEPDPTLDDDFEHLSAEGALPQAGWTALDQRAIDALAAELDAVRPLLDVFDGELEIMLRLETAISNVQVLRDETDRDLMVRALLFQGLAVRRYFQDGIAEEDGAKPYRATFGDVTEVRPWTDAVALDPTRQATLQEIPEEPELLYFQETRARHLLRQTGSLETTALGGETRLFVDGAQTAVSQQKVLPGKHRFTLRINGEIRARAVAEVAPGSTHPIRLEATSADIPQLVAVLQSGDRIVSVPTTVQAAMGRFEGPVHFFVQDGKRIRRYALNGEVAVQQASASGNNGNQNDNGLVVHIAAGAGWMYDGDFLLLNASDGAPEETATVNAAAPLLSAAVDYQIGPASIGIGADGMLPVGEFHTLPSGERDLRARFYPHLRGGLPWLQATAGFMFPRPVGLGARGHWFAVESIGLELNASWVGGIGIPLEQTDGSTFDPDRMQVTWAAVGIRR